jgi:hypothetical protein
VAAAAAALFFTLAVGQGARADDRPPGTPAAGGAKDPAWYERIHIRGYTQLRYNRIGASNPHLKNDQGDRSIGDPGGFFIRRARLLLFGDLASFISIYLQPDFASAFQDTLNFGQLRDWYTDIFLDSRREFRFRVGQSKVPYGFELMQSSQNRAPLDRNDALNSAFQNERDLGAYFYFAPESIRKRFKHLVDSGLKGSGDYGMVAVGVINGQPLNTRERNDNKHFVARITVPFEVGSQTVEIGGGGYTGLFVPTKADGIGGRKEIRDLRMHATFVLYPRPIGLQAEYNAGVGPELVGNTVVERPLDGGYVMAMARIPTAAFGVFTPYVRLQRYDGGKKFETNAPRHEIRELNAGVEWQIAKWLELTAEYMESERTVNSLTQAGRLLRLQLQFNY